VSKIRPQIVLQPSNLSIAAYEPDKKFQNTVILHDWSDVGLKIVQFQSDDSWISVSAPRQNRDVDTQAPFLPWTTTLTIDTKELSTGRHTGRVDVTAKEKDLEYSTYLMVLLNVESPIRVVPSNLFFGEVRPHETAVIRCTMFVLSNNVSDMNNSPWASMTIVTDLPSDTLKTEIVKETETRGMLNVSLTPRTLDPLQGNVTIKLGDGRYHELLLPVIASVKSEPLTSQERKENYDENVE
jgi:hypothetical protein